MLLALAPKVCSSDAQLDGHHAGNALYGLKEQGGGAAADTGSTGPTVRDGVMVPGAG